MLAWLLKPRGIKRAPISGSPSKEPASSTKLLEVRLERETTLTLMVGLMRRGGEIDELIVEGFGVRVCPETESRVLEGLGVRVSLAEDKRKGVE